MLRRTLPVAAFGFGPTRELPHYPEDDPLLPLRQACSLAQYGGRRPSALNHDPKGW